MDFGLQDKVALVCGASRGLGLAAARALAAEGAHVVLSARHAEDLQAARVAVAAVARHEVQIVPADLSRAADVQQLVDAVAGKHGALHVLVANQGGPPAGPFGWFDDGDWQQAGQLLVMSVVRLVRRALPVMLAQQWGRVIAVTSVAARQPLPDLILSNTYRAGVHGFIKTLALQHARDGVTFNCVMPGFTATERLTRLAETAAAARQTTAEAIVAEWQARIPAGRLGQADEFGAAVAFLASAQAGYITGASLPVDGGFCCQLF